MKSTTKILTAFIIVAVAFAFIMVMPSDDSDAADVSGLVAVPEGGVTVANTGYYIGTSGTTVKLPNMGDKTTPVKLYVQTGCSVTITNVDESSYGFVKVWAVPTAGESVTVEDANVADGACEISEGDQVVYSFTYANGVGTATMIAVTSDETNINVIGALNVSGTWTKSLTLYNSNAQITASDFTGTIKCGTSTVVLSAFTGILTYGESNTIYLSGYISGTVTGNLTVNASTTATVVANLIINGIVTNNGTFTYGMELVKGTTKTYYPVGADAGEVTLATGDKFTITNGSAVVKHIVLTTLDNEVTFKDFVAASTKYVEITATSDSVTTMESTAFSKNGCTGGTITVNKGVFALADGSGSPGCAISGSCGCTVNFATIGHDTDAKWTFAATKLSDMLASIDATNCVLAIMGTPAVLTDTLDLTEKEIDPEGDLVISLYAKKATITSLTIVNDSFTHTMAFDHVDAKIWNVHVKQPTIDSMDGITSGSGTKGTLIGTLTLKAGEFNVPKDGLKIGYVASNPSDNVAGSILIDNWATLDTTMVELPALSGQSPRTTIGPVTITTSGNMVNNGTLKVVGTLVDQKGCTNAGTIDIVTTGVVKFEKIPTNNGTITNAGEISFIGLSDYASPGINGIITSGADGKMTWYPATYGANLAAYIYSGDASGSFKVTGTSDALAISFTAGTANSMNLSLRAADSMEIKSGVKVEVPESVTVTNEGTITNAGTLAFKSVPTNTGTITNTGEIKFIDLDGYASPGAKGITTSGANGKLTWYKDSNLVAYIYSGDAGSFKVTGTSNALTISFTAGTANSVNLSLRATDSITIGSGVKVEVPESVTVTNAGTITNAGTLVFKSVPTNNGTITNTGEIAFVGLSDYASPGTNGITTSGADGKLVWYASNGTTVNAYIYSGDASGSFKVTGASDALVISFTAGTANSVNLSLRANDTIAIGSGVKVNVPASAGLSIDGSNKLTTEKGASVVINGGTFTEGSTLIVGATGKIKPATGTIVSFELASQKYQWSIEGKADINESLTIAADESLTVDDDVSIISGKTLTVSDNSNGYVGQTGILGSGTIVVLNGGILSLGNDKNDSWLTAVDTKVMAGGTVNSFVVPYNGTGAIKPSAATATGYILASHNAASGDNWVKADGMTYTIAMDVTVNEASAPGTILADNTAIITDGATVTITALSIPQSGVLTIDEGAKVTTTNGITNAGVINANGELKVTTSMVTTGAIAVGSEGQLIGGGTIDFKNATTGSKVLTVANGGLLTIILDGSDPSNVTDAKESVMKLVGVTAGANGITVSKGSVVIDGTYTTDADGTITITSGTATITGIVDEGVKIVVPAGVTVNIPEGGTLEFDAGSSFENSGTIKFESKTSSTIIYEEGSTVNGVEIEVTTKQTDAGIIVAIIITLKTANADKLLLKVGGQYFEVFYVEAFEGDSYADALAGIEVESLKSRVSFDGWYNVLNEKVTSGMKVGSAAPTLTAKFTETPREGVTPYTPSIEPTVITVDETGGYDNTTMLVAAVAMLVVAIFVLGYVVIVKRK